MLMAALVATAVSLILPPLQANRRAAIVGVAALSSGCSWPGAVEAFAPADKVATSWTLPGGVVMPTLALNTAGLDAEGSERALIEAYTAGFRHVDFHPGIERDGVARALASMPAADRSRLFLTTKIRKPPVGTTPDAAYALVRSAHPPTHAGYER
jgi:hypothetical protein